MPTLGFPAWLSMNVQLNYCDNDQEALRPRSAARASSSGWVAGRHGLQQDGAQFSFEPHAGLFNATVTFIWRRAGKLLGQMTRTTTAGHRNADFGSPPHYSAQQCRIP